MDKRSGATARASSSATSSGPGATSRASSRATGSGPGSVRTDSWSVASIGASTRSQADIRAVSKSTASAGGSGSTPGVARATSKSVATAGGSNKTSQDVRATSHGAANIGDTFQSGCDLDYEKDESDYECKDDIDKEYCDGDEEDDSAPEEFRRRTSSMRCDICKKVGHNKRICQRAPVKEKGASSSQTAGVKREQRNDDVDETNTFQRLTRSKMAEKLAKRKGRKYGTGEGEGGAPLNHVGKLAWLLLAEKNDNFS